MYRRFKAIQRFFPGNTPEWLQLVIVVLLALTPFSKDAIERLLEHNVPAPWSVLLMRPKVTHECYSAVPLRGGPSTGATFFGHADWAFVNDSMAKNHYGHWTFYSKAVVYNARNVSQMRETYVLSYVCGQGIDFVESPNALILGEAAVLRQQAGRRADIVAVMEPFEWRARDDNDPIDMTGSLPVTGAVKVDRDFDSIHDLLYSSAPYTSLLFKFDQFLGSANRVEFERHGQRTLVNTLCSQDHVYYYTPRTSGMHGFTECTGHLGRLGNTPHAARVRNGGGGEFIPIDWNTLCVQGQ
jgi:hypothetical protein